MAAKQDNRAYALIDLYVLLYEQKNKRKPTVNKYRDRWGFTDMIDSIGYERSVEVMKYYFSMERDNYNLGWLLNNFDRMEKKLSERDADRKRRAMIRAKTEARMKETP